MTRQQIDRRELLTAGIGAITMTAAGSVIAQETDTDKDPTFAAFTQLVESGDVIKLKTAGGSTGGSVSVASDVPGMSRRKAKLIPYILPEGYVRKSARFETSHHSGDSAQAKWNSDDVQDATVYLRVRCTGVHGAARAAVRDAYGIKEDAARRLSAAEKEARAKMTEDPDE